MSCYVYVMSHFFFKSYMPWWRYALSECSVLDMSSYYNLGHFYSFEELDHIVSTIFCRGVIWYL